jgi:hypothetical protein
LYYFEKVGALILLKIVYFNLSYHRAGYIEPESSTGLAAIAFSAALSRTV